MKKILIIQTAFIGDVILATALIEKLHVFFPEAAIDFLLRKGNESLLTRHPHINEVLIWDKKKSKYANLIRLLFAIRDRNYDLVVNLQRFVSTGFLAGFSGAKQRAGFDKNPLSFLFTDVSAHHFSGQHEIERNLGLISKWTDNQIVKPKLYPGRADFEKAKFTGTYLTLSPASVWYSKQLPAAKWIEFLDGVGEETTVFLLGGKGDFDLCEAIRRKTTHSRTENLAGKLTLLESAALMKNARMNFVNDSAPLHLASSVNAPVTAIFCSTIPNFGFTPLSDDSTMIETGEELACRPCGLHGRKSCPEGHFKCSDIDIRLLLAKLD